MDRTLIPSDDRGAEPADATSGAVGEIDYESIRHARWRGGKDVFEQNLNTFITGEAKDARASAGFARVLRRKTSQVRISEEIFEQIAIERSEIAFSEFYERLSPKVYGFLLRLLRSEDDALDILQDAFAELWNKAPILYKIHTNLAAWSLHLARNLAITQLRSKHRKYKGLTESFEPGRHEELFPDERTPEQTFTGTEARTELKKALDKLEPDQRKTIEMVFFGGLTRSAAAEKLHITPREFQGMLLDSLSELEHELFPLLGTRSAPKRRPSKSKIEREEKAARTAALQKFLLGLPLGGA